MEREDEIEETDYATQAEQDGDDGGTQGFGGMRHGNRGRFLVGQARKAGWHHGSWRACAASGGDSSIN